MAGERRSWGELENLTLTEAELAQCEPIDGEGGKSLRAFCPFHGSDKQRSLRVNTETGHFKCFMCDAWGYLDTARESRRNSGSLPTGSPMHLPRQAPKRAYIPTPEPEARPELADRLATYRTALASSPGEAYLRERRIPLELAQAVGIGYAAPGTWGNPARDWHRGRVVFPHTTPSGDLVNLYGRAIGDAPKGLRHDHLAGAKGFFNAQALRVGSGPVTVCEGAFDALALMAAGAPRVVAIFGVNGWRWEWAKDAPELILALDADETGAKHFHDLAREARLRGKRVAYLEPGAYGDEKDASAAWSAGSLELGEWAELFHHPDGVVTSTQIPESPQETRDEPVSASPPSMSWSDALAASRGLDAPAKQTAYEMSYGYLESGAEWLAQLETELREDVSTLADGDALPELLAVMLFAWSNATYMATHRQASGLPESWKG